MAATNPTPADPNCAMTGTDHITPPHPYPTAVPGPIAGSPNVCGTRGFRDDLNFWRRRSALDYRSIGRGSGSNHRPWRRRLLDIDHSTLDAPAERQNNPRGPNHG